MAFTRDAVLLKWNSGATERAFKVLLRDYRGGEEDKPASYSRSLYDGSLQRVFGSVTPRRFVATILGEDSPSGSTGGVDYGSITELKQAWAATDLQCKSFEDSDYWDAEWMGAWPPLLDYDPKRRLVAIPIVLEKR
jgi:hypothetical protein